jgi:hypothetical protein
MNAGLQPIQESLEKLRDAISAHAGITENLASFGPHVLPVGKATLLRHVYILKEKISAGPDVALPKDVLTDVPRLKDEIDAVTSGLIPQVGAPNAGYAAPALVSFLLSIPVRLKPVLAWSEVVSADKMPAALAKRTRELDSSLDSVGRDVKELASKKRDAETILASVEGAITAGRAFAAELEKLNADAKSAADGTKEAANAASKNLEQIATVLKRADEIGTALAATAETTNASAVQVGEAAKTTATLAGQVTAQAESVAKAEQRVTTAAEEGAKSREKVSGEAENIAKILAQVTRDGTDVQTKKSDVDTTAEKVKNTTEETLRARERADGYASEAEGWAKKSQDAYRIVTTTGLAGAFNQRAKNLTWLSVFWLAVLAVALVLAALIGSERTKEISSLIAQGKPEGLVLLIQLVLSVLTVGAPVWMAWLATKQIAHSFRLAEDYGYKAAMAKAYEGFKEEAVQIDKQFEARLFASALERLNENPIRLLSASEPGSPMHDFMQNPGIQRLMETVPEFKTTILDALKGAVLKGSAGKGTPAAAEDPAKKQ